jgi:hypothetical protein
LWHTNKQHVNYPCLYASKKHCTLLRTVKILKSVGMIIVRVPNPDQVIK